LVADGKSSTSIVVTSRDAFGNPTTGAKLDGSSLGTLTPFTFVEARDVFTSEYTAPVRLEAIEDSIVIRDESAAVEATLPLRLSATRRRISLGASAGYVSNFGKVSSPIVAADLGVRLPFISEILAVGLAAEYTWSMQTAMSADGNERVDTSMWALPILVQVTAEGRAEPWGFYGGLLAGAAVVGQSVSAPTSGKAVETAASFAVGGRAGVDFASGPGRLALEAGYLYAPVNAGAIRGNVVGLSLALAYRLQL
jgi:hypothetical protein